MSAVDPNETPNILECTKRLRDGSKCSNPRVDQDPAATNRHCREHRTEQHRRYFVSMIDQQRGKGYTRGIESMRALLIREFTAQGQASFTGVEIAGLIKQAPGPTREPEVEEKDEEEINPKSAAAGAIPAAGIVS
jgi:hypothetical protein